jgi:hypothetical protein
MKLPFNFGIQVQMFPTGPLCSLRPFSAFSVLLILRFVASRAEMLPSEAVPASIWSAHVWLRLRRAMLTSEGLNTEATEGSMEQERDRQE